MKFQLETSDLPSISGYGPGWLVFGGQRLTQSFSIDLNGQHKPWGAASFEKLSAEHFATLLNTQPGSPKPELLLFGSGHALRFVHPSWLRPLIEAGVGVETMDTPAACRTWNILASEGRRALAALVLEPGV